MAYLTQNATLAVEDQALANRTFKFFAVQNEHNHDKSIEFTKAIKALLKQSFHVADNQIRTSSFRSNQSSPPPPEETDRVQLYWKKIGKSYGWTNK